MIDEISLKTLALYIISYVSLITLSAQGQFNNWYFGQKAGIHFNDSSGPKPLKNSQMHANGASSSISDSLGNLLFYTNGGIVWNKNHDTMLNGEGLSESVCAGPSMYYYLNTTALIVKQPGNKHNYFVFSLDSNTDNFGHIDWYACYAIVDMSLDGGLGGVVLKNKILFNNYFAQLSAVRHANNTDVWLAGIKRYSDTIFCFKITDTGVVFPAVINRLHGYKFDENTMSRGQKGQFKFSPDGRRLGFIYENNVFRDSTSIYLMDFNNSTGLLSNLRVVQDKTKYNLAGLEFSPNGKFLYTSESIYSKIYQTPIDSFKAGMDFLSISREVSSLKIYEHSGDLQLAPDGKIYIATFDTFLNSIERPNEIGNNCGFKHKAVLLSGLSLRNLPAFVQSDIYKEPLLVSRTYCQSDTAYLSLKFARYDSLLWDFGDGHTLRTRRDSVIHTYKDSGSYRVRLVLYQQNYTDTLFHRVQIRYIPRRLLGNDTIICKGSSLLLFAGRPMIKQHRWGNGDTVSLTMPADSTGVYTIRYRTEHCYAYDSIQVTVAPKPTVYLGNDTSFCHAFSHLLNAGTGFKTYTWNTGDTGYTLMVNTSGRYSVRVTDTMHCAGADTIDLDEIRAAEIGVALDTQTCRYVYLSVKPHAALQFLWSTGDTGTRIRVDDTGLYYVTQVHRFCSRTDSVYIKQLPMPVVDLGPDTTLCQSRKLNTQGSGTYMWNTGETSSWIWVKQAGTYSVTVNRNGCSNSDTITLSECPDPIYFIPDAFSPDGNANNEVFKLEGIGIRQMDMQIYNRWGGLLYKASGENIAWDGRYLGDICPQGTYLYYISMLGDNGKMYILKGIVHLIR